MKDNWIRTDRLVLRPWEESDANRLMLMTQEQGFRALWGVFSQPMDAEKALEWVRTVRDSLTSHQLGSWAMVENGHVIGCASLVPRWPDLEDDPLMAVEYRLLHSARGRGLATEAMQALMEFGSTRHGFTHFHAFIPSENTPAKKVAFKIGMTYWRVARIEGVMVEVYRTHAHPGEPRTQRSLGANEAVA